VCDYSIDHEFGDDVCLLGMEVGEKPEEPPMV